MRCRVVSPDATLPHALCRLMSLNVAICRRSPGQILGQSIRPAGAFLSALKYPICGRAHLTYNLFWRLFLAESVRSSRVLAELLADPKMSTGPLVRLL